MINDANAKHRKEMSRRRFLGLMGAAGATTVAMSTLGSKFAFATPEAPTTGDVIVFVNLFGGADALNMFAPITHPEYISARPRIGLTTAKGALPMDGQFWMHPAMAPLYNGAWKDGKLAVVHACGWDKAMFASRSHFDAQTRLNFMHPQYSADGFLNRFAGQHPTDRLNALGFGMGAHPALIGNSKALSFDRKDTFDLLFYKDQRDVARTAITSLYTQASPLGTTALQTLPLIPTIRNLPSDTPQNGAVYGNGWAGPQLQETARLIRAKVGLRSVAITIHGWDTHASDVGEAAAGLSSALQAFYTDLGPSAMQEVTVVVASEFGRTVKENSSAGTDHGRGGAVMVMGGNIKGGVYGKFPTNTQALSGTTDDSNALPALNDYRLVLSEVMQKRGGATNLQALFPDYVQQPFLGLAVA